MEEDDDSKVQIPHPVQTTHTHSHDDIMNDTAFLSSCNFLVEYLDICDNTSQHHGEKNKHDNFSHANFSISSISSEDAHCDNSERTLPNIQKVFEDFCSKYNDEKKASHAPVSSAKYTEVEDIDDIIDNSIDIIFEVKEDNCVGLYDSQITLCENKAEDLFDDISVHLSTNNPPDISDDTTTDGK